MGLNFFKKKNNDKTADAGPQTSGSDISYSAAPKKRLGVFGGTFDPMHRAHLDMALKACRTFSLDRMFFMPSGESYFKTGVSSAEDRLEICRLSVKDYSGMPEIRESLAGCEWSVSDLEVKREGKTYTYETIETLRAQFPDYSIYFLVGEDTLRSMETWREPQIVFAGCIVITAARPARRGQNFDQEGHEIYDGGQDYNAQIERLEDLQARLMKQYPAEIHIMRFDEDMSSSSIKEDIRSGIDAAEKIMPSAYKYINDKMLYK